MNQADHKKVSDMMSPNDLTWTSGLIPMIEPEEVTNIISRISDIAVILSKEGHVKGVMSNPSFRGEANLSAWENHPFADTLLPDSTPKLARRLAEFEMSGDVPTQPLELNHVATAAYGEFPMRYSFHRIGGDGALLLLGSDLRSTAEMQQQLVAAQIALEQDYEAQRDNNLKFRVLMSTMDEPVLYVSARTGLIIEANAAAATLIGRRQVDVAGLALNTALQSKSSVDLIEGLLLAASEDNHSAVKATTNEGRKIINLRPKLFRTSGEQMLLCKLSSPDGPQARPEILRDHLVELFESGIDAIVFVRSDGTIMAANEAFVKLADVALASSIKGRSLADFLNRGSVDLNVIMDNAKRTGGMRQYATKIKSELGEDRAIDISTSRLQAGISEVYALIIRDASRIDTLRPASGQSSEVDMRTVIEYIGSQSLKDIVAKTTDVVEKMCIETAVEMTSNNRVAAAEMLGLSRQSLYVKLRKYGLVKKD